MYIKEETKTASNFALFSMSDLKDEKLIRVDKLTKSKPT